MNSNKTFSTLSIIDIVNQLVENSLENQIISTQVYDKNYPLASIFLPNIQIIFHKADS